jgi:hypothetical protein
MPLKITSGTMEHCGTLELGDRRIMKEQESFNLLGKWKLTAKHIHTGEIIVKEGYNLKATCGLGLVGDMLIDTSGYDTGLTYQAIGTSATAVAITDTTLTAEAARKAITSRTRAVSVLTFTTFFTAGESTFDIQEAGVFGHSTASGTADSGILFSHYLVDFDNSGGLYDLTFDYSLSLS